MSSRNPSGDLFALMAPPMASDASGLGRVNCRAGAIPVAARTPRTDRHAQVRKEYDVIEGEAVPAASSSRPRARSGRWTS